MANYVALYEKNLFLMLAVFKSGLAVIKGRQFLTGQEKGKWHF